MRKINQQLSSVDSSGTIATLERMKDKVMEEESLAQAYGEMSDNTSDLDDQIEKALAPSAAQGSESLAQLKKKMGIGSQAS